MLNTVILNGRLVSDIKAVEGKTYGYVTLAVQRNFKNKEGKYESDFISGLISGKALEIASKYLKKGDGVNVHGRLSTRKIPIDGSDKTKTELCFAIENIYLDTVARKYEPKAATATPATPVAPADSNEIEDDDDLPF